MKVTKKRIVRLYSADEKGHIIIEQEIIEVEPNPKKLKSRPSPSVSGKDI